MEKKLQDPTFRGLDGYAGFRHGQAYTVEVSRKNDGNGEVQVSMPHAQDNGLARFSAQQWAE